MRLWPDTLAGRTFLMLIGMTPFLLLGEGDNPFDALLQTVMAGRSCTHYMQFETTGLGSSNALILFLSNGLVLFGLNAVYPVLVLPRTPLTTIVLSAELAISFLLIVSGGGRTRVGFLHSVSVLVSLCKQGNRNSDEDRADDGTCDVEVIAVEYVRNDAHCKTSQENPCSNCNPSRNDQRLPSSSVLLHFLGCVERV